MSRSHCQQALWQRSRHCDIEQYAWNRTFGRRVGATMLNRTNRSWQGEKCPKISSAFSRLLQNDGKQLGNLVYYETGLHGGCNELVYQKKFLNCVQPTIYTDFRALSSECTRAQNNYFTSAQHPLNMAGVGNRQEKSVIKLFPAAHLQSPTLWLTRKLPYQLCWGE
jgi:hypothetical protein